MYLHGNIHLYDTLPFKSLWSVIVLLLLESILG